MIVINYQLKIDFEQNVIKIACLNYMEKVIRRLQSCDVVICVSRPIGVASEGASSKAA